MRRATVSIVRMGVLMAVALAGAAVARAQPTVSIEDVRVVEGSGAWPRQVTVRLSEASATPIDVGWHTVSGSATASADFVPATTPPSLPVHFDPGATSATLSVVIQGDGLDEWNPAQMDEAFFIDLEPPPAAIATLLKSRATVTIVDDDRPLPGLQYVSAVADGPGGSGRVRLQWRVPASSASGPVTDVLVRWNTGSTSCAAPADAFVGAAGQFYVTFNLGILVNQAGETQIVEHLILPPLERHCYALFAIYFGTGLSGTPTPERATIDARPFLSDPPNPVAWAYSTGYPDVVPPTVGEKAVYTVSTDGVVHAMERTSGTWPSGWNPVSLGLGKAAHNRSPVVPLPSGQRFFVGTEAGEVHAVNGEDGAIAWSRSATFAATPPLPNLGAVQATPAGLFKSWGGDNDLILVGTNAGTPNNYFYMLDPETGLDKPQASNPYTLPSNAAIRGMAAVEYSPGDDKVYFLTTSPTVTLWGLDLTDSGGLPAFEPLVGYPLQLNVGANGSPVFRNGRIYFGAGADLIMYPAPLGGHRAAAFGNGEIKGFVFPDRRDKRLYFSTAGTVSPSVTPASVWCIEDTVENEPPSWYTYRWRVVDIPTPSIVVHRPGTRFLYVGGGDGHLYEIDVDSPSDPPVKKPVPLEPGSLTGVPSVQIGAPSLDGPNNLVLVGSMSGVVYAVRVPLP